MEVVYRASELGGCTRRLVQARLGYTPMEPPEKFKDIFAAGVRWEDIVKGHLRERGFFIVHEQELVRIAVSQSIVLDGHLDGVMDRRVLEIKSMASDAYVRFVNLGWEMGGLMEQYKWQVSAYMVATGRELQFLGVDKSSDPLNPTYFSLYLEKPFYTELEIKTRVLGIESYAMPPDTCDKPMFPCPFFYTGCTTEEKSEASEEVRGLVLACMEADREWGIVDKKRKELRAKLMGAMGTETSVRTDDATVSVVNPTSNSLDKERIAGQLNITVEELTRFYSIQKKGAPYVRISKRRVEGTKQSEREDSADRDVGSG